MAVLASKFKERFDSRRSSLSFLMNDNNSQHEQRQETRTGSPIPPRISLENSAFHVSRGGAARKSAELPQTRYEHGPQYRNARTDQNHHQEPSHIVDDAIPDRRSSRFKPEAGQEIRRKSLPGRDANNDLVPKRASSRPAPAVRNSNVATMKSDIAPARRSSRQFGAPNPYFNAADARDRGREGHQTEFGRDMEREMDSVAESMKHITLPPDWKMNSTVQTHVTEEHRPAVTQETIIKERTEIVQEQITRDLHIHHHYTYLQPVRVVEVLPAKHFVIDAETGEKVEIPAPPGWRMPEDMTPKAPDTSMVKGWTRHYLVDEEHPQGVLEGVPEHEPRTHGAGRSG